jgi:hypothetical protein
MDGTTCLPLYQTRKYGLAISRRTAPEVCISFAPSEQQRAPGRPGARCTRGLVCKNVHFGAHEHTGSAETLRHPPRNGFTAYSALSPATNSSCHRHRRIKVLPARLSRHRLRRFSASNGRQDHTASPYAIRLRQKASARQARQKLPAKTTKSVVRRVTRKIAHGIHPALRPQARLTLRVHRIPWPT